MRILELLAFEPLSAPQLATALHAHPRTIRRVLHRLVDEDYLTCSDDRRRVYTPTMRIVALAGQVVERAPLARHARPYVRLLQERTGAEAHLVAPSYLSVVCIVHADTGSGETAPRLREVIPAHATAGGKALLAFRDRWSESLLGVALARFTDRTITDSGALRRQLEEIRASGHALEDGEYERGVRAVAAPVLAGGIAVAALGVSGRQLNTSGHVARVAEVARELSSDLAADAPPPRQETA
jgi:DNA-binding IclR family transcriptional regulator